jgi:predicted nuclease with RNAse H fold
MKIYIGVDISEDRGCAIAAIDKDGRSINAKWSACRVGEVLSVLSDFSKGYEAVVGIDAPRMPLSSVRTWYWNRKMAAWRPRMATESGWGRHCEVVIKSLGLANPQWTPPVDVAPGWMRFGFELFSVLNARQQVQEVFPTASYSQLVECPDIVVSLPFSGFAQGPKDMLDAYVGAVTVREYDCGRGCAVGGGDQLGSIVLPRQLPLVPTALFEWPVVHAV